MTWLDGHALAQTLSRYFFTAAVTVQGKAVDLAVAQGRDRLLHDPVFGLSKELVADLADEGVTTALQRMLARQAVLDLSQPQPSQRQAFIAKLSATKDGAAIVTRGEMASTIETAVKAERNATRAGRYVRALSAPAKGKGIDIALATYRSLVLARMKDRLLQDPKRSLTETDVDALANEGVTSALSRVLISSGCKITPQVDTTSRPSAWTLR